MSNVPGGPSPKLGNPTADSIRLKQGDPATPQDGEVGIILDSDGTLKSIDSSGTKTDLGSGEGGGITALTGDATASGTGSVPVTVANIPTGATLAAKLTATAVVAPATPAAGKGAIYVDSTSKNLCVKDDAGTVKHGVQSQATSGLIVSTISDAGVVGTLTVAQARALLRPTYYVTGAGQYLTLSGLDGDADGDYDMVGAIVVDHNGSTFAFEPNSQNSNLKAICGDVVVAGSVAGTLWNYPGRAGANPISLSTGDILTFTGIVTVRTGARRMIVVSGMLDASADNAYNTYGQWTETATNLTSFRLASSQTDGFAAGSYLQLTARGRS